MGYYTKYTLFVRHNDLDMQAEVLDVIKEGISYPFQGATGVTDPDGGWGLSVNQACKWYENHKDMIKFSKKYPTILFTLKGEGEESGDLWMKYFKNGKVQMARAQISFAEFDEKLLK